MHYLERRNFCARKKIYFEDLAALRSTECNKHCFYFLNWEMADMITIKQSYFSNFLAYFIDRPSLNSLATSGDL